jgi:hypothetical protein
MKKKIYIYKKILINIHVYINIKINTQSPNNKKKERSITQPKVLSKNL